MKIKGRSCELRGTRVACDLVCVQNCIYTAREAHAGASSQSYRTHRISCGSRSLRFADFCTDRSERKKKKSHYALRRATLFPIKPLLHRGSCPFQSIIKLIEPIDSQILRTLRERAGLREKAARFVILVNAWHFSGISMWEINCHIELIFQNIHSRITNFLSLLLQQFLSGDDTVREYLKCMLNNFLFSREICWINKVSENRHVSQILHQEFSELSETERSINGCELAIILRVSRGRDVGNTCVAKIIVPRVRQ